MKNNNRNFNGIKVNDSIIMSIKKKQKNPRTLISIIIALGGYLAIISIFFNVFKPNYDSVNVMGAIALSAIVFSVISLLKDKVRWLIALPPVAIGIATFLNFNRVIIGLKFTVNTIYKVLNKTEINYFKGLDKKTAQEDITIFLIIAILTMAFILFLFTVYKPNVIIVVAVTFPIFELCLYYGVEVPILWSSLLLGYWFALFSITSNSLGEYNRGSGGFTFKDNVFLPKRKMKFKVTEFSALLIMMILVFTALISKTIMDITDYERSEILKQKRKELKLAINSFSIEDLINSFSNVTDALGFSIEYQDNRLGRVGDVSYKETIDLILTLKNEPETAIYLKGFNAGKYNDNEWFELNDKTYNDIVGTFSEYGVYPQEFAYIFNQGKNLSKNNLIEIKLKTTNNKFYSAYGVVDNGEALFINDSIMKLPDNKKYSYDFSNASLDTISKAFENSKTTTIYYSSLEDKRFADTVKTFCEEYGLSENSKSFSLEIFGDREDYINNNSLLMTALIESQYREFVYDNYLQVPDNVNMEAVYKEYEFIFDSYNTETVADKLLVLNELKKKMNSTVNYTLNPGKTPSNRDFVNYFLLENKKGYCVHYATSGVILARMAGIPARYATGYISVKDDYNEDTLNYDGSYTVELLDNRSHAWTEVYIDGYGWVPFEFTAGYSSESIMNENTETTVNTEESTNISSTETVTTVTQEGATTSRNTNKTTTTKVTETETNILTTLVTGTGNNDVLYIKPGQDNFKTLKLVLRYVLILFTVILLIFARRWVIIKRRKNLFNSENKNDRVNAHYRYIIKILKYLKIKQDNLSHNDFELLIEKNFSGVYFAQNNYSRFNELFLKNNFSNAGLSDDEILEISKFSTEFSTSVYEKSVWYKKIYLKLISVLY